MRPTQIRRLQISRASDRLRQLAARLNLTPLTKYALGDEDNLVREIVGLTGVVLISWEHKRIFRCILPAIANGQTLHGLPTDWYRARFDVVLDLTALFQACRGPSGSLSHVCRLARPVLDLVEPLSGFSITDSRLRLDVSRAWAKYGTRAPPEAR